MKENYMKKYGKYTKYLKKYMQMEDSEVREFEKTF